MILVIWSLTAGSARGEEEVFNTRMKELSALSLQDLLNLDITVVSKQKQKVGQAAAAVSVITQEDIRRSGMTSIPDLLRLSPGLDVARVDANTWAISSRGFNDVFANKLLVLMDGRTVYSPAFSGVYWDTVDYMLPDLEQIEVVRGPGATLWGANAVNGVINIISKSARDTQGLLVQGVGGNEEQIGSVRYGGRIGDHTYYRVYSKWRNEDDAVFADGERAHDGWEALRGGFRIDHYASDSDTLTLQGDAYGERTGHTISTSTFTPPTFTMLNSDVGNQSGGNVLARWKHVVSPTSDFTVQLYYDAVRREDFFGDYSVDTFDADLQHHFELTRGNDLIWGAGVRFQSDEFSTRNGLDFTPSTRDAYIINAFLQDDIALVKDRVHVILGSKFEQNSYTGFEIQPSARVLWTPDEKNTVWGSISRAVRTPSRADEDSRIALFKTIDPNSGFPTQLDVIGNNQVESEELTAYELGYRTHVTKSFSVDATAFYNRYNDLLSLQAGNPEFSTTPLPPHIVVPAPWANTRRADTYGLEVAANWSVTPNWRLTASYTWLTLLLHSSSADRSPQPESTVEDNVPRNQAQIRSYLDITKDLEFNAAAYFVESLSAVEVPGYVRVDLGLTWRPKKDVELSLGVQNLLDDRHPEFGGQFGTVSTEMQRAVYGQLMIRF